MKYLFAVILIILFLSGCATTQQNKQSDIRTIKTDNLITVPSRIDTKHIAINDNITAKASLVINFPAQNNSVSANIEIAGMDSILIKISAFLGINVGQLYANQNKFIMNNNFENTTYIGVPTEENIMKAVLIPLSFNDLASILKCIPPQKLTEYKMNDNTFEFAYENKTEFFNIGISEMMSKLVRMDKNGNELFSVEYGDFVTFNEKKLAKKIIIKFAQQNGRVEINYSDIQFKEHPSSPMKITKPRSYKLQEFLE